jgi:nitrite reductase/ring-hydroxylating ferredoxin subunit
MVHELSRRAVLAGCGAACLSALVGCGDGGGSAGAPAETTGRGPAAGGPTGAANPTGPPEPVGFLARLTDVPVGGGEIVDSLVLVVQPAAGVVKAFDARCPHAGIIVGTPDSSGVITCPGHLAHYRADDGSLIDGPSPHGLDPIAVRLFDGVVLRA